MNIKAEYLDENYRALHTAMHASIKEAEAAANEYASTHMEHISTAIYYVEDGHAYEVAEIEHDQL